MAKYHIKRDGTPGICHTEKGSCPLGGAENHFPSQEAAQQAADERNITTNSLFLTNAKQLDSNKKLLPKQFTSDKNEESYFEE